MQLKIRANSNPILRIATGAMGILLGMGFFTVLHGADLKSSSRANTEGLSEYPKNLARLHLGATVLKFDSGSRTFVATEAAPAWLDDDESTGWAPPAGKQFFLISLSEPTVVNHFSMSASASEGTVSLYVGDEKATPDSSTWKPLLTGVSVASLNEKLSSPAFSRYGRFLLVETDFAKAAPLWSLYVFGTERAADYRIESRVQKVDTRSILGPGINETTVFDVSNLYSGARVVATSNGGEAKAWQAMVDESPESFWIISPTPGNVPSAVIDLGTDRPLRRISALVEPRAGVLEFFLVKSAANTSPEPSVRTTETSASEFIPASNPTPAKPASFDLTDRVPFATLGFDGTSDRESLDISPVEGRYLLVRWKGSVPGENLKVRQIDGFSDLTFDRYAVVTDLMPVAERRSEGDGKQTSDGKGFKGVLDPIAEGPLDPVAEGPTASPLLFNSGIPPITSLPPPLVTSNLSPE